jgi:DNA-directed RNA polymerase subunit L
VSFANALRRTILSDIPVVVIQTETEEVNQCKIEINTGRLHNEILKHRLSCIPIHTKDLKTFSEKYRLEVDVKNEGDNTLFVTTEDFKIRNKESGNFITKEETRNIFPPNSITGAFIDFARLRPKIGDEIPGEHLKLVAEFSIATAKDNSMFNVASKCSYANTPDLTRASEMWERQEAKLREEGTSKDDIAFQRRNFYLLDAQRFFESDSFDFVIQTLGVFDNPELVWKACAILQIKMITVVETVDSGTILITPTMTTMEHSFDIFLDGEDYTVGKVLEYILYETHYMGDKSLTFCGFKKFHPHDTDSRIRVAFVENADNMRVKEILRAAAVKAVDTFEKMYKLFAPSTR